MRNMNGWARGAAVIGCLGIFSSMGCRTGERVVIDDIAGHKPKPNIKLATEPGNVPKFSRAERDAIEAFRPLRENEDFRAKIEERTTRCAGEEMGEVMKDVMKDSARAALDAGRKSGATPDSVQEASEEASREAAEKRGSAVPLGLLECVVLKPALKAFDAHAANPDAGSFRQQFMRAMVAE